MKVEILRTWVARNKPQLNKYREYLELLKEQRLEELVHSKECDSQQLKGRIKMLQEQIVELSSSSEPE